MTLLFYKLASFTVIKREYKQNNVDMFSTGCGESLASWKH